MMQTAPAAIRQYLDQRRGSVPLVEKAPPSLRTMILSTSGLHHKFMSDEEWAKRVNRAQIAHDNKKADMLNGAKAGVANLAAISKARAAMDAAPCKSTQIA